MNVVFEELDYRITALGALSLRRRSEPMLEGAIVYEVKLDDAFLMSSLFTDAERGLATLALDALDHSDWDVVVGGLGLGYTAAAVLECASVRSLAVIERLEPVIGWHRRGLVPEAGRLVSDPRCTLVHADFFERAARPGADFGAGGPGPAHAVLLDIDHSPRHWLDAKHAAFYSPEGLGNVARRLHPGGVFGLWSNERPDDAFTAMLGRAFESAESHVIAFANPYTGGESSSTVYLAKRGP